MSLAPRTPAGNRRPASSIRTRLLRANDAGRLGTLLPIRYARMAQSPLGFLRGAGAIMAADLAAIPVSGLRTQVCGDAHLLNFGAFASPERNVVFDVNDFDETIPGAWEWDVRRLAISVVVAARQLGFAEADGARALARCLRSYREHMSAYAGMDVLDVWYARLDDATTLQVVRSAQERRDPAPAPPPSARTTEHVFPLFERDTGGVPRIVDVPPLIFHPDDRAHFMHTAAQLFADYRSSLDAPRRALLDRFRLEDAAYKVVGVGSVGTRCLIGLFAAGEDDTLVLQAKEARDSVFASLAGPSETATNGERVVDGQRLMQGLRRPVPPGAAQTALATTTSTSPVTQHEVVGGVIDRMLPPRPRRLRRVPAAGHTAPRARMKANAMTEISGYLGRAGGRGVCPRLCRPDRARPPGPARGDRRGHRPQPNERREMFIRSENLPASAAPGALRTAIGGSHSPISRRFFPVMLTSRSGARGRVRGRARVTAGHGARGAEPNQRSNGLHHGPKAMSKLASGTQIVYTNHSSKTSTSRLRSPMPSSNLPSPHRGRRRLGARRSTITR